MGGVGEYSGEEDSGDPGMVAAAASVAAAGRVGGGLSEAHRPELCNSSCMLAMNAAAAEVVLALVEVEEDALLAGIPAAGAGGGEGEESYPAVSTTAAGLGGGRAAAAAEGCLVRLAFLRNAEHSVLRLRRWADRLSWSGKGFLQRKPGKTERIIGTGSHYY